MWVFSKTNPRRDQLRKTISSDRLLRISRFLTAEIVNSCLIWLAFVIFCTAILSFELLPKVQLLNVITTSIIVIIVSVAMAVYIHHYQRQIIANYTRAMVIACLLALLLAATKLGLLLTEEPACVSATVITVAIIMAIAYDQRFALGMSVFYGLLACLVLGIRTEMTLLFTMAAGVFMCCFSLREIRTRMKLLEVGALAAAAVFLTTCAANFLADKPYLDLFKSAGFHASGTLLVGLLMQSLLPLIERTFRIATSMTLLDYSDANQPLLKKLAMEAPGTFSHSLLVGSLAEAAAETVGLNGLLCRVGAYYHDIGKINKPGYFIENQMGSSSRHKELSPAMSQLIIVGHVKDGIEMAKGYGLPAVLRQFIETHHGTTLVEYFYNEARKKSDEKQTPPSESEFRYAGPRPQTKEAAIVMLADTSEGAVRSLPEISLTRIETVVHNMAMKRLQDGQFDLCDLTLKELSQIESSISKSLAAHYHGRIAYPRSQQEQPTEEQSAQE